MSRDTSSRPGRERGLAVVRLSDEDLPYEAARIDDAPIRQGIHDAVSSALGSDDAPRAQDRQMLGCVRLTHADRPDDFRHGRRAPLQEVDDLQADGVGHRLAEVRLDPELFVVARHARAFGMMVQYSRFSSIFAQYHRRGASRGCGGRLKSNRSANARRNPASKKQQDFSLLLHDDALFSQGVSTPDAWDLGS